MELYVVQSGDTASGIARSFGVSEQRIIADNGLDATGRLVVGQALIILFPEQIYTVQEGDSLFLIASRFGTTTNALLRNNPWLTAQPTLIPGQLITIRFTDTPQRTARINGYAYPFISRALLARELPFLSTLTVFGYGFTDKGTLIESDDTWMLEVASESGVAPILLLSSITENGNFSSERASLLFNSVSLQNQILNELVGIMRQKGYRGLDIDFEYVKPEDAEAFLLFVQNAVLMMHRFGYFVNVDLAPKTSPDQPGLLYEAHDYAALGAAADTVLLMTYEWGYTYGPPMAVAPIGPVTAVVDFGLSQIPAEKILLGVPNYGYDWRLPFEKGITRAESLSNEEAPRIAYRAGVPILYDETAQSPWFNYREGGVDHVVWFEDVRSIDAKLSLMTEKALRGVGYWNLMKSFAQNWAYVSVTLTPERV